MLSKACSPNASVIQSVRNLKSVSDDVIFFENYAGLNITIEKTDTYYLKIFLE